MARARERGHGNERVDVCGKEWEPESARDAPKQGKESEPKQVEESEGERASEQEREWAREPLSERKRNEQAQ